MRLIGLLVATVFAIILSLTQNNKTEAPAATADTTSTQVVDEVGDVPVLAPSQETSP